MPVNLKNEKALNSYIERLVYHGGTLDSLTENQLKDANFIRAEKDKVIRAMTYQWMKKNVRDYLTDKEDAPFLERIKAAENDSPEWLKQALAKGKAVYIFDEAKVPDSFHADLQNITDYLYSSADNYIGKVLNQQHPHISLDALKQRPEHKTFALTLEQANKWHEQIAREASERKLTEAKKAELSQGTKFIMDLGDGFTAVQLLTREALDKESEYMGHCVGQGSYDKGVKDGTIQIYSLRDKDGEPHATFEVRDGEVMQCKGKANKPVIQKYLPYVTKFVSEQHLDLANDLKNMGLCRDIDGNLHSIYNIPAGTVFEDLDLSDMGLTELSDLSKVTIKNSLDIKGNPITSLEGCPSGLKVLYCNDCNSLKSLKGCPEGLKELCCCRCDSLASLEGCPDGLEELDCCGCKSLTSLGGLPEGLKKLDCSYCESLTSLEGCPECLEELDCRSCKSLTSLEGCPKYLEKLNCSYCDSLTSLEDCPKGLEELDCCGCKSLTSLKGCPTTTKALDCSHCNSLTSLEGCPDSVTHLHCNFCDSLASLEGCPEEIRVIYCAHCDNLKYIPDYIVDSKINSLSKEIIAECKNNWRKLQKSKGKINLAISQSVIKVNGI